MCPFLSLLIVVLTCPLVDLLVMLVVKGLIRDPALEPRPVALLSLVVFVLLFEGGVRFHRSFGAGVSVGAVVSVFVLDVSIRVIVKFVSFVSGSVSLVGGRFFAFPELVCNLILVPILRRLDYEVVVVGGFGSGLGR